MDRPDLTGHIGDELMRYITRFRTNGAIPLDAFTTFGVNHKPTVTNPFGYFGTGLKYAVSIILKAGGTMRVFIDLVEYEFYIADKDFRGKNFEEVRMRKRKRNLMGWHGYQKLPFTTELGKNWDIWQAYRELESNTRDENGTTETYQAEDDYVFKGEVGTTTIYVDNEDFMNSREPSVNLIKDDDYGNTNVSSSTFLEFDDMDDPIFSCRTFEIYEGASRHFYYQGIRVYDLQNPSRYTYNFKSPQVDLSEDRTAKNIWSLQYCLAEEIQEMDDYDFIESVLKKGSVAWFETDTLQYHSEGGSTFREVVEDLGDSGMGRMGVSFSATRSSFYGGDYDPDPKVEIELRTSEWEALAHAAQFTIDNDDDQTYRQALAKYLDKWSEEG